LRPGAGDTRSAKSPRPLLRNTARRSITSSWKARSPSGY
jgi:hypothetical protein